MSLEIEKKIEELNSKIKELELFSTEHQIDLSTEIEKMKGKIKEYQENLYQQMDVWQRVQLSRHIARPTTLDFINYLFDEFIEFHGDRLYAEDPAIVGGIATFKGKPVTVIGHQKGQNTKEHIHRRFGMAQPEGYRKALRLMQQANKFNRPIITFINTAGAFPGKEAEERGQSEAIARNLREMASFGVPIICFVIGEGGSGGALALGVGNEVYMLENTFYSVISPEGAAALLWKDKDQAKRASESLKISPQNLLELGVIDGIIEEPIGGSHNNIKEQTEKVSKVLSDSLEKLSKLTKEELKSHRYEKYRKMGEFVE